MTTRRKKNNNNNKSKKVKKYIKINNTRKRSQMGGLAKPRIIKTKKHILKNPTQFKKKAKGRRGTRGEGDFISALAVIVGDPKIPQKVRERKDPTAVYDVERGMSPKLRANYSIKSVAKKSHGQNKYQICMGNTCRVFNSFSEADNPLHMAIIIRHEYLIESGQIPLLTMVYDMNQYKPALFGNLSDIEIRGYSFKVNKLERFAKEQTYDVFKPYANYESVPASVIAEAQEAKERINQSLTEINNIINRRGGKLVVRLSEGNWFSRRTPRIVSHWDFSPTSPRISKAITVESNKLKDAVNIMKESSSDKNGQGSVAAAAAVVPGQMVPRRLLPNTPSRSSIRNSSSSQRSLLRHHSRSSTRPSNFAAGPARPSNVAAGPAGIAKPKIPMIPEGSNYSEINVSNLLRGELDRLRYRPSTPSRRTRSSIFSGPTLRSSHLSTQVPTTSRTGL